MFLFLFFSHTVSLTRKIAPCPPLETNFPFPITMKTNFPSREREKLKKKRNCKCIYLNSIFVNYSKFYFWLLVEYN